MEVASDGPLYAYDMTYETPELKARGAVDPTQPEGSRVTVHTPAKADWPDDFEDGLEEMDKNADGDIWCAQFADAIPSDAKLMSETETTARYSFTPKPDSEDKDDAKFMKHITGIVEIDTQQPAILSFALTAPKPFKPA